MAKLASSTLLDHKALIRADFAAKGLNFKKFRGEVEQEISGSSSDGENPDTTENVPPNNQVFKQKHISEDVGMQLLSNLSNNEQLC